MSVSSQENRHRSTSFRAWVRIRTSQILKADPAIWCTEGASPSPALLGVSSSSGGEGSGVRHPSRPGVPCGAGGVSHSVQWDVGCGVRRCNPFLRAAEHVGEETDPSVRAERQARPLLRPARPDAPGVFRGRDGLDLARNGPRRACGPGARRASPHQLWGSTECCTASGSASGCSVATPASTGKSPRLLWPRREERWGRPTPARTCWSVGAR